MLGSSLWQIYKTEKKTAKRWWLSDCHWLLNVNPGGDLGIWKSNWCLSWQFNWGRSGYNQLCVQAYNLQPKMWLIACWHTMTVMIVQISIRLLGDRTHLSPEVWLIGQYGVFGKQNVLITVNKTHNNEENPGPHSNS